MKSISITHLALFVLVAICAACSTVYEGKYDREAGWRSGTILHVAQGDDIVLSGWRDCRNDMPAEVVHSLTFATIEFFGHNRKSSITVPLQEGAHFKEGDPVYVNIKSCQSPVETRLKD
jgi:hypothetical protein